MNNTISNPEILNISIPSLNFSTQFQAVCQALKFSTLSQILEVRTHDLLKMKDFDVRMLHEYIVFLEKHKLAHLVKD